MSITGRSVFHMLLLFVVCVVSLGVLCAAAGCGKKVRHNPYVENMTKIDFTSKVEDIKQGMSYEEVVALLNGVQGKDITMPLVEGAPPDAKTIKQYQWVDDKGNMLLCSFQGNKLASKDMTKLPANP